MLPLHYAILVEAISIASSSTTRTVYFSRLVSAISAFASSEISFSNMSALFKSAAEAWICLFSFSWFSFQSRFPILICNTQVSSWSMNMFSFRSSHRRFSVKKGDLKNFANFARKHLCWSFFLIKLIIKFNF